MRNERFWKFVEVGSKDDCWPWVGARKETGYGVFKLGSGRQVRAHRHAYEQAHGRIPKGSAVRHTCDNPSCVNPDHLVVGSHSQNMGDMVARGRSPKGKRNCRAKLTEKDVVEMREMRKNLRPYAEIAKRFSVSLTTVYRITSGRTWRHVQV